MAAVTQIRHRHSEGRAYYDRKVAEGKGHREALRSLKRPISDALYACMIEDAMRDGRLAPKGPGGQTGNDSVSGAAGLHPRHRLFGQATPGPVPTLRPSAQPRNRPVRRHERQPEEPLDKQRGLDLARSQPRPGLGSPAPDRALCTESLWLRVVRSKVMWRRHEHGD